MSEMSANMNALRWVSVASASRRNRLKGSGRCGRSGRFDVGTLDVLGGFLAHS
jgi:hypothetical protein